MNWADWTILAILAVSSLMGLTRGFVKEALALLWWVAAFVVSMTFHELFAQLLSEWVATPSLRKVIAFVSLFAFTLIVGSLVNYLIGELIRITGLSGTDRLLGMVFGIGRGVVVVLAVLLLVPPVVPIDQDVWWQQSLLIPHFLTMEGTAKQLMGLISTKFIELF